MRINYHVHNRYSSDGRGSTEEVCRRAEELGFDQVCFTNHAETLGTDGAWSLDLVEARTRFEELQQEIEGLRPAFPELRILLGIEVEYRPEWVEALDALVDSVDFDLVIGSVHYVDGYEISAGPSAGDYFKSRERTAAYGGYYGVLEEMVDWGGFDIVGHFDLVKRYGAKFYAGTELEPFLPQIRRILGKMVKKGLGLEVNTSGVVQAPAEPYPALEILRLAEESHVATVTIGTDSHVPRTFEQGWEVGELLLKRAGFSEITTFSHRIRKNVPLEPTPEDE